MSGPPPSAATSGSEDEYLAIVTTKDRGVHEHKLKKSENRPKPDEIVAEVVYSGLNHIDVKQVQTGAYISAFPFIIGKEWSGKVLELGSDVKDLNVGDAVIGIGYKVGSLQERITTPRAHVCLKPDNLSFEEGATIGHRYAAIFVALFFDQGLKLPLEPSEEEAKYPVIVWGAGTGSGMFAIQALKAHGYKKVIAVASSRKKDGLIAMGASDVFDRSDTQVAEKIKAEYPDISLGLPCQIDANGWKALLEALKPDGVQKKNPAVIASIVGKPALEVPTGVDIRGTVVFDLVKYPLGGQVIAKYLPKLLNSSTFKLPKAPEAVSKESLLKSAEAAMEIFKNTEVSVVLKIPAVRISRHEWYAPQDLVVLVS